MSSNSLNIFKCINIFEHVLYRTLVTLSLHFILADRKTHGFHILRRFLWRFHGSHIAPIWIPRILWSPKGFHGSHGFFTGSSTVSTVFHEQFHGFPRFFHGVPTVFHGSPRCQWVPYCSRGFHWFHGLPRISTVSRGLPGALQIPWIPWIP